MLLGRPPALTLFPYTTLFRSPGAAQAGQAPRADPGGGRARRPAGPIAERRSEEHTSELQSLRHLVCRLLLEKKRIKLSGATTVPAVSLACTDVCVTHPSDRSL